MFKRYGNHDMFSENNQYLFEDFSCKSQNSMRKNRVIYLLLLIKKIDKIDTALIFLEPLHVILIKIELNGRIYLFRLGMLQKKKHNFNLIGTKNI